MTQESPLPLRSSATNQDRAAFLLSERSRPLHKEAYTHYKKRLESIINQVTDTEVVNIIAENWANKAKPYQFIIYQMCGLYKEPVAKANLGAKILDMYQTKK